jgi:alpha-beta hydrolase superfamily lysophospholipase
MKRWWWLPLVVVVALGLWLASPLPGDGLRSRARPARDYGDALRRIGALRAEDGPGIAPECGTRLLTHGHPTRHVVVMFHGLTNCPAQFESLGRMAFRRGANVLIPRLPRHGFADRMTDALAGADAQELRAFTDRVLDAASGLGDRVTVTGLSVGGTLATWAAQERADVDRAVLIAPMLGVARAPGAWTPPVTRLLGAMPNVFVWWDDRSREDLEGPKHVYPRFATRAVAATLRLGAVPTGRSRVAAPAARSVVMVTVGGDEAVDNGLCDALLRAWRARGAREALEYRFPAGLRLNHDVVDPEQVGGNPAITYPVLAGFIGP